MVYQIGIDFCSETLAQDNVINPYNTEQPPDLNPPGPEEDSLINPDAREGETLLETSLIIITNYILTFVGVVALIIFIYGGFLWITAYGNDTQFEKAKNTIIAGVIGIIVIISAYAIVNTILVNSDLFNP